MFNNFKKIVSNFSSGKPLNTGLEVESSFQNNDVEAAGQSAQSADQVRAQAEGSIANSAQSIGRDFVSTADIIENAKNSSDQFIYSQAIKTANESRMDRLRQASISNNSDELSTIYNTSAAQNKGLLESLKDKLPDAYYQSIASAIKGHQDTLFAYTQKKKQGIVANTQFNGLTGSLEPTFRQALIGRDDAKVTLKK